MPYRIHATSLTATLFPLSADVILASHLIKTPFLPQVERGIGEANMSAVEKAADPKSSEEKAKCLAGNSNEAEEEDSLGKPCCRIPWRGCLALLGGFLIQGCNSMDIFVSESVVELVPSHVRSLETCQSEVSQLYLQPKF